MELRTGYYLGRERRRLGEGGGEAELRLRSYSFFTLKFMGGLVGVRRVSFFYVNRHNISFPTMRRFPKLRFRGDRLEDPIELRVVFHRCSTIIKGRSLPVRVGNLFPVDDVLRGSFVTRLVLRRVGELS